MKNVMLMKGDAAHLNPFSAHKKAMREGGVHRKPASKEYCSAMKVQKHINQASLSTRAQAMEVNPVRCCR